VEIPVAILWKNILQLSGKSTCKKHTKEWRDKNPDSKGNIRDYANAAQLVCLSNMENLNALFIKEGLSQAERLQKLNQIAISQMRLLTENQAVKALEDKKPHP
jgi:hypothetical protein